jgi:hypothetical protein
VSISGKSCGPILDGAEATRILNNLKGTVTIVAATNGRVGLIECMIVNKRPGSKSGLGLQLLEGKLQMLRLDSTGLWTYSLLNEGNYILSINGVPCSDLDGPAAECLIDTSENRVTIVAKSVKETSVVFEEQSLQDSHARLFRKADTAGRRWRLRSRAFYGPCFQGNWSPAKVAHMFSNAFVLILTLIAGIAFDIGLEPILVLVLMGIIAVNVPWIGWSDRGGAWCSVGQVLSTIMVIIGCSVVVPISFGTGLTATLGRNLGFAIPMTVIINLPMHFTIDHIDHYTIVGDVGDAAGEHLPPVMQARSIAAESIERDALDLQAGDSDGV